MERKILIEVTEEEYEKIKAGALDKSYDPIDVIHGLSIHEIFDELDNRTKNPKFTSIDAPERGSSKTIKEGTIWEGYAQFTWRVEF